MINIKSTILKTINDTFNKMRLLGRNDPKLLKKILYLIVLDDIYDWSNYLNETQSIQKKLQDLRTKFIQCNPEFVICRFSFDLHYVNVNTPQTNDTWKRIWDEQPENLTLINEDINPDIPAGMPWKEDASCSPKLVYFGGELDGIKKNTTTGTPLLNINNLTICEKMDLYIDRTAGIFWYIDVDGTWKRIENQGLTEDAVIELIRTHRGKINRTWNETDNRIELEILADNEEANSNLDLVTLSDVEAMI